MSLPPSSGRSGWRLVHPDYAANPFSGQGAYQYGGRWNSAGTRVVYLSENLSLAALEIIVHTKSRASLTLRLAFRYRFEAAHMEILQQLPEDWQRIPFAPATQAAGDAWVKSRRSLVLAVPSVISPLEFNYLLNPLHSQFAADHIEGPFPYRFDPRLMIGC